jgi:hypothetical protein
MTPIQQRLEDERPPAHLTIRDATLEQMFDELAARMGEVDKNFPLGRAIVFIEGRIHGDDLCEAQILCHGKGVTRLMLEAVESRMKREIDAQIQSN